MIPSSSSRRDEPSSLLAVRPQLPPGVPAAERLRSGRHLQTGRVPLEAGAGEAPGHTRSSCVEPKVSVPFQVCCDES